MPRNRVHLLLLTAMLALGSISLLFSPNLRAQSSQVPERDLPLPKTGIDLLQYDDSGLQFELNLPSIDQDLDGFLQVDGLNRQVRQPGAPALPYYGTWIVVPPGAQVSVRVQELGIQTSILSTDLAPVAVAGPQIEPANGGQVGSAVGQPDAQALDIQPNVPQLIRQPDSMIYRRNALYPSVSHAVSPAFYFRGYQLVQLDLFPLRYNPISRAIRHASQQRVFVRFELQSKPRPTMAPLPPDDASRPVLTAAALNGVQAMSQGWYQLPEEVSRAEDTHLPKGKPLYKIELDREGIYEISGADLAQAGMDIGQVNPHTIEMMYRGQPVAYEFVGDSDSILAPDERIRFYGWPFAGSRAEKQFVSQNVYWLWDNGTPTPVMTRSNLSDSGFTPVTQFDATLTREPENHFFATWTRWDQFPNEPDAWYWSYIRKLGIAPITQTYQITLPNPAPVGPAASLLVEISSRENLLSQPHIVRAHMNGSPDYGSTSWFGRANVNITHSIPVTSLAEGINQVQLVIATESAVEALYLNRITVDYRRELKAVDDQLIFESRSAQPQTFHVGNFSEANTANALIWDISQPTSTIKIDLEPTHVLGSAPYTYTFGTATVNQEARFIVTTAANVLTSARISEYYPADLTPADERADWLAITHSDFLTAAQRLADHRADPKFGQMDTFIVDSTEIINQFGYGLPLPQAIRDYLTYALGNWQRAPSYVVLMGDATQNPRNLDCLEGCSTWDQDEPTYLITDLLFEDRFQGLIPTDHSFVLLSGNDLVADMAVGRIAAATLEEAAAVVNKIIKYEENLLTPADWQRRLLFVADNRDEGGAFCLENQTTAGSIPSRFDQAHLCLQPAGNVLDEPAARLFANTFALTTSMSTQINQLGVSMLNYRGHGSIDRWASEQILTSNDTAFWNNPERPLLILSADCLDGHFAWPGRPGLGETFLKLGNRGSAAHWSSSGLGYSFEHTVLHTGFLEGIFSLGLTRIGDAVNYAKMMYDQSGNHQSELYSFILQGDPAMLVIRHEVYLPLIAGP